jgi:hypothetical protein
MITGSKRTEALKKLVQRKINARWRLKNNNCTDKKCHMKTYQEAFGKLSEEMRRLRDRFFRERKVAMQLLADKHDYEGLFKHINRADLCARGE